MLNEIMDGVTKRLDDIFPDCQIYTDAVSQGLLEPCFFVQLLEPSENPMIGNRAFRQTGVCIQFLPGDVDQPSRERNRVVEDLMNGMEYIQLTDGSLLRGTGRNCRTEEGVLHFFVNYNAYIYKRKQPKEPMGTIEIEKGLVK